VAVGGEAVQVRDGATGIPGVSDGESDGSGLPQEARKNRVMIPTRYTWGKGFLMPAPVSFELVKKPVKTYPPITLGWRS
jgi:hypothetical protein